MLPLLTPTGATSIGDGLAGAWTALMTSTTDNARCSIVLLSDGMENSDARWSDVVYEQAWLVNILDDIEEAANVNIELDARIYKFDTVSFSFDKTSARAMLQMMGDTLLFRWIVRGDTIYVYKERHEILFGGKWLRQQKKAWRTRKKAIEEAAKEAERKALEEGGKDDK